MHKKITIVRKQKKRPLRFFAMLKKTILALTKNFLIKFEDTLFGNLRSWKRSQGQTTKKYYFSFFGDRFGILGEFPLRIWFSHPHGTCRF